MINYDAFYKYGIEPPVISDTIITKHWSPCSIVLEKIELFCKKNELTKILEIGPGYIPFSYASHFIDKNNYNILKNIINIDINIENLPFTNLFFDFCYSRHTLEDIYNPYFAFKEIIRTTQKGYIETPSPLIELSMNVDASQLSNVYRGYIHHRYIIWSDIENNVLCFLPKMPIIEHINFDTIISERYLNIINNYPILWNNYYFWDETNPPLINMIDFDQDTYFKYIEISIQKSIDYTGVFINKEL
jgi:hypothetical protein